MVTQNHKAAGLGFLFKILFLLSVSRIISYLCHSNNSGPHGGPTADTCCARVLFALINANTSPVSSVSISRLMLFFDLNYKIKVIYAYMLVLRFLAIFSCGFAVFDHFSMRFCGF